MDSLISKIRDIPDFPIKGIIFKDITPLVQDPASLRLTIAELVKPFKDQNITAVAGMEARGFIFGSLVAWELGLGFIPLRKPGKLPYDVQSVSYDLEYGQATLEAHIDAINPGDKILLVDDVLATGGTAKASCELVEMLGGQVVACAFVIELAMLNGREKLTDYPLHSLITYS
ncbi:adenine phosphoribosyltransferase [Methylophaga sp. 41_12_T18]|nr:adenine phosphoribosyltransferase [Methylophaga sp. 41_12_T18]